MGSQETRQESGRQIGEFSSSDTLERILDLHRQHAPAQEVYLIDKLCFPLEHTSDPLGVRYVLWTPLARFLEFAFPVEILDEMCEGHLLLANLSHEAAMIAEKLTPLIDRECRKQPFFMLSSGPQVMVSVASMVSSDVETRPQFAEKIGRMYEAYKGSVRKGQYSGLPALRAQLSEFALTATESELKKCIEILRHEADTWPFNSAAQASERSLARDWLTPEEDAAWSHL
jgi:hypothetical protein